MGTKVPNGRTARTKEPEEPRDFETLVRKLVAHAQRAATTPTPATPSRREEDDPSNEVLVDCEVDGVRRVLARAPTSPVNAFD